MYFMEKEDSGKEETTDEMFTPGLNMYCRLHLFGVFHSVTPLLSRFQTVLSLQ